MLNLFRGKFNQICIVASAGVTDAKIVYKMYTINFLEDIYYKLIVKIMAINSYSERFLQVIDKLGVTDYFVWNNCEAISKAQMSHIRTGKGGASLSIIEAFCNQFPEVNANYILTGKGDMFLNTAPPIMGIQKEGEDELPAPESAEYWERMYKSAVTMYEAMLQDLEERFNTLDKSFEGIRALLMERKEAV